MLAKKRCGSYKNQLAPIEKNTIERLRDPENFYSSYEDWREMNKTEDFEKRKIFLNYGILLNLHATIQKFLKKLYRQWLESESVHQ